MKNIKFVKISADFLRVCNRDDVDDCVSKIIESSKPYLAEGIPDLDIPKCEPLTIPEISLNQGAGPLRLKSNYQDIQVWGCSNFKIKHLKIDLDENLIKMKLYVPKLSIKAKYSVRGRIIIMPVFGNGICHGNYTGIKVDIMMRMEKIDLDGEEYLHCKETTVDFKMKHAKVQFDDLFDGNAIMGTAMNAFLDEHKGIIIEELKPMLTDVISELFRKFANGLFGKVPYREIFPERS